VRQVLIERGWLAEDGPETTEAVGTLVDLTESLQQSQSALRLEVHNLRTALIGLSGDGHCYGSRPCVSCDQASKALGEPFGCDSVRAADRRLNRPC
jgi:hypothetical protein